MSTPSVLRCEKCGQHFTCCDFNAHRAQCPDAPLVCTHSHTDLGGITATEREIHEHVRGLPSAAQREEALRPLVRQLTARVRELENRHAPDDVRIRSMIGEILRANEQTIRHISADVAKANARAYEAERIAERVAFLEARVGPAKDENFPALMSNRSKRKPARKVKARKRSKKR